jgi:formylglycine-generating enzyme required for sulfatase activity
VGPPSSPQAWSYSWRDPGFKQSDEHPVVDVNWNDAVAFCEWLSRKEGKTCRLPTEAEWEYACRAGTTTRYSCGDDAQGLADVGKVADAGAREQIAQGTTSVGTFRPNAFGLYDMHGNVSEWCADWYDPNYYANSSGDDPSGPSLGSSRVCRGGSWSGTAGLCRSALRGRYSPEYRRGYLGFRVLLVPAE